LDFIKFYQSFSLLPFLFTSRSDNYKHKTNKGTSAYDQDDRDGDTRTRLTLQPETAQELKHVCAFRYWTPAVQGSSLRRTNAQLLCEKFPGCSVRRETQREPGEPGA